MADSKKYYYMKLKDDFFESEEIILLETLPDGLIYQNILLKMYCKSLKSEGRLMFNNVIPYNAEMIAKITRSQVGTVEKALDIFKQMGLIEVLDNGAIYMMNIQQFIGKSSTEADRKKQYRQRITAEKQSIKQIVDKCPDNRPPEIEIEKEIEIEREIEIDSCGGKPPKKTNRFVKPTLEEIKTYCQERKNHVNAEKFFDYYEANGWVQGKGKPIKDWKACVRTWERNSFNYVDEIKEAQPESGGYKWQ
jgi:predicted phage replisome organizer